MKTIWAGVIAVALSLGAADTAQTAERNTKSNLAKQSKPFMSIYGRTLPPIGYIGFCRSHPAECRSPLRNPVRVIISKERWQELTRINAHINTAVEPVTDQELYNEPERWTYPRGQGDCEDYVLLKRRYLINLGWPEQALLITVVRDQNNEGHAVLTVSTDRGDLILDNQSPEILLWQDTPYRYEKRQSQSRTNQWVSLNPASRSRSPVIAGGLDN
jgi:predicted transglutaminase-like cysteine proteinase